MILIPLFAQQSRPKTSVALPTSPTVNEADAGFISYDLSAGEGEFCASALNAKFIDLPLDNAIWRRQLPHQK
jgi:hypothetical protein